MLVTLFFRHIPGKSGVAVMLYDPRKSNISRIEKESGVTFEHLSAPQPADVAKAAGKEAADIIADISDRYGFICAWLILKYIILLIIISTMYSVIPVFKAAAEELLNTSDLSPAELLAKALAKAAVCFCCLIYSLWEADLLILLLTNLCLAFQGYSEIKTRSLLTSMENCVTLLLECGRPIFSPS